MLKSGKLLLVDRGTPPLAYLSSVLALKVTKNNPKKVIVLTDVLKNEKQINIYKSYNFKSFELCFNYSISLLFKNIYLTFKSFYLLIVNLILLKFKGFEWFKFNFHVEKIYIGDLFQDTNNRYHLRFLDKKIDLYLINILFKSIFRTLKILDIIKKKNIKLIVSHHSGYSYNGSISVRVGVKLGIKVLESKASNYISWNQRLIRNGFTSLTSFGLSKKKFRNYSDSLSEKKLNHFLKSRFKKKLSNFTGPENLRLSNISKKNLKKKDLIKLYNFQKITIKKIILIAPHAFSDASHVVGTNFIFEDYYDHLFQTLKFIKKEKIKNILWIVRPHPSSKRYGEEGVVEKLIESINYKFIKICPHKVSTKNLIDLCDNVVTGRGTIGLEFACFGKHSLISGASAYSDLGVSLEFKRKKKYFTALKNICKISKLSKNNTKLAKSIFYYLEVDSQYWKDIWDYNKSVKIFKGNIKQIKKSKFYKKINFKLEKRLQECTFS